MLAALNGVSELALIRPDGTSTIELTAADGLRDLDIEGNHARTWSSAG